MALSAVQHAVNLGACRATAAIAGTGAAMAARSCTPSSVRRAPMVPRTHEVTDRVVAVCGQQHIDPRPMRRDLSVTPKSAGAQRQDVGQPWMTSPGVRDVPTDQRGMPVGGKAEFAGDGGYVGGSPSAQAQQVAAPAAHAWTAGPPAAK